MSKRTHDLIQRIAIRCMDRLRDCPDYSTRSGKKNDEMCINYFIGAATMADVLDDEELKSHLEGVIGLVICIRGVEAVKDISERFYIEKDNSAAA